MITRLGAEVSQLSQESITLGYCQWHIRAFVAMSTAARSVLVQLVFVCVLTTAASSVANVESLGAPLPARMAVAQNVSALTLTAQAPAPRVLSAARQRSGPCAHFDAAFAAEIAADLWLVEANCRSQLTRATLQPFGPPTAFEISQVVCRGDCRDLTDRLARIASYGVATGGCGCAGSPASDGRCPHAPALLLCADAGICVGDAAAYDAATCASTACGRWAGNEVDWRAARRQCGLADGAGSAGVAAAAAAATALAALAVAAGRREG